MLRTPALQPGVDKDYTSQVCPQCDTHTGKKDLSDRLHVCHNCGYTTHRDVAAAQVIRNRGISALGRGVEENACGDDMTRSLTHPTICQGRNTHIS